MIICGRYGRDVEREGNIHVLDEQIVEGGRERRKGRRGRERRKGREKREGGRERGRERVHADLHFCLFEVIYCYLS